MDGGEAKLIKLLQLKTTYSTHASWIDETIYQFIPFSHIVLPNLILIYNKVGSGTRYSNGANKHKSHGNGFGSQ